MRNYQNYLNEGLLLAASLFVFSGCQQPVQSSGKIEKFKSLSEYSLNDFRLAKDVRYFSVNVLFSGNVYHYDSQNYKQLSSAVKRDLEDAKKDNRSHFRLYIPPNACLIGIPAATISYVDSDSKVHMVTNKKALKVFLGNIDTPAEVKVWLMLNGKREVENYKKRFGDYRAWFCDEASFSSPSVKCSYAVTPHGSIEKQ